MGMDVFGKNKDSEVGRYFRNNVWWWRPLADYCKQVAPEICSNCQFWHSNDGDGLNAEQSRVLALALQTDLDSGKCEIYAEVYEKARAEMPKETCELCKGSGARTDAIGVQYGLNKPGGCNGCEGTGKREGWEAGYPFSVENVKEFVAFLNECEGFEIW